MIEEKPKITDRSAHLFHRTRHQRWSKGMEKGTLGAGSRWPQRWRIKLKLAVVNTFQISFSTGITRDDENKAMGRLREQKTTRSARNGKVIV